MNQQDLQDLAVVIDRALDGLDTTPKAGGSDCARRIAWALAAVRPWRRLEVVDRILAGRGV